MWSDEKQGRFAFLHGQATRGGKLTDADKEELQQMYDELDEEERLLLTPALRRLDEDLEAMRLEKTRLELALQRTQERVASEDEYLHRLRQENGTLHEQVEQLMEEYKRRFGKRLPVGV